MRKNPLLKNQAGLGMIIEIVLIAVVLVVVGLAVARYFQTKPTVSTTPTPSPQTTSGPSPSASPTPVANPYAGWQTFVGTCSHYAFQYPADWKLKLEKPFIDGACQPATVTSPTGNVMVWVAGYYGDGPGCDWSQAEGGTNECPTITTIKAEEQEKSGALLGVYLVEQVLCDDGKCKGRIALVGPPTQDHPRYTVGTSQRYPLVTIGHNAMFMTQGKQTSIGNPTIPLLNFSEASAKEWLKSDDVQKAKLAMRSLVKQ